MTIELIINALLSLAVLATLLGVFRVSWTALRPADQPDAVAPDTADQSLPYAA